jgi:hypothetical protein
MCHCGISTVTSLRQKSLSSIDSYRQLSTSAVRLPVTERGITASVRLATLDIMLLFTFHFTALLFILFFVPSWDTFFRKRQKECVPEIALCENRVLRKAFGQEKPDVAPLLFEVGTGFLAAASLTKFYRTF